jgi:hypothetical protein
MPCPEGEELLTRRVYALPRYIPYIHTSYRTDCLQNLLTYADAC